MTAGHLGLKSDNDHQTFTPNYSDQCQIFPAASPEILHHTVWRTWLFTALRWKMIILAIPTTSYTFQGWDIVLFGLGSERLTRASESRPIKAQKYRLYTINSHCITYTFLFRRLGECTFWTCVTGPLLGSCRLCCLARSAIGKTRSRREAYTGLLSSV